MKKIISVLLISILTISLLTGCGSKDSMSKCGYLSFTNETSEELNAFLKQRASDETPNMVEYDNLSTMIMALQKGEIDYISVPGAIADYLVKTNPDLELMEKNNKTDIFVGFSFMFKDTNVELRDQFNEVIKELQDSGELSLLKTDYLYELDSEGLLATTEMPYFDGAKTITVAVTGDLPPMDYIDAYGAPSGFNTALLAAIANKLQINIEFISIDAASRAIALSTGKADVSFWALGSPREASLKKYYPDSDYSLNDSEHLYNADVPAGTIISDSYSTNRLIHVTIKK